MKDPEFVKKLDEFMDSKVEIVKSKYDCTMVETSINEVLKDSILGSADDIPREIYHGTNIYSYNDIVKVVFHLMLVATMNQVKECTLALIKMVHNHIVLLKEK